MRLSDKPKRFFITQNGNEVSIQKKNKKGFFEKNDKHQSFIYFLDFDLKKKVFTKGKGFEELEKKYIKNRTEKESTGIKGLYKVWEIPKNAITESLCATKNI